MNLRELAQEWEVDPEPLIRAVDAAMRVRQYRERQKLLISSAEPAQANHRLRQAHKAVAALPLRARAALHWAMVERIASGPAGLDHNQIRRLMQDSNLVDLFLDALSGSIEPEEPDRECQWLVQAWLEAGGQRLAEDGSDRYHEGLIEFLTDAYTHLGETPTDDAIRRRLDRIRRSPLSSEG